MTRRRRPAATVVARAAAVEQTMRLESSLDSRRHLLAVGIAFLAAIAVAVPAVALSSGIGASPMAKRQPVTTQWIRSAATKALRDPAGIETHGCPWLTDHDLSEVWGRLTRQPFGVARISGSWILHEIGPTRHDWSGDGFCHVDWFGKRESEGFEIQVQAYPRSQPMIVVVNGLKRFHAWYPDVSVDRSNSVGGGSEQVSRKAGPRVVVTLAWRSRATSVTPSEFRIAIDTVVSRMRERMART